MIHEMDNAATQAETAPIPVGVIGVSGYSGMEVARIVSSHPRFQLALAVSDRWAGEALGQHVAVAGGSAGLVVTSQAEGIERLGSLRLVFLCTPPEASMELGPRALAAGARVVDLSGAFRLGAGDYPRWYGFTHACPDILAEAVYSMPE